MRRSCTYSLPVVAAALALTAPIVFPGGVRAEGVHGSVRLGYSDTNTKRTDKVNVTESERESDLFLQRYNLTLDKSIYPNLSLRAGGVYDVQESNSRVDGASADSKITKMSPFANLTLSTPLYTAGVGYDRFEEDLGGNSTADIRENYRTVLAWRPDRLPKFEGRYVRTNTYDRGREFEDRVEDFASFVAQYRPVNGLDMRYRLAYRDRMDEVTGIGVEDVTHNANVRYTDSFWDGRLLPSASYTYTRRAVETTSSGQGEIATEEDPAAGLFSVDETPDQDALDDLPALIDDDLAASAGVNLGLSVSGGGDRDLRNLGVEFFATSSVNTLRVQLDPAVDLTPEITSSFSWDVYFSSDGENWVEVETVHGATFDRFDKYFEIRFPLTAARYIKATTRPLSLAIPIPPGTDAADIFVTELQAFLTEEATEGKTDSTSESHVGNIDARFRVFDAPFLFYDFSYWFADANGNRRDVLSNGLSARHVWSPKLSASGRIAVENGRDPQGRRLAFVHFASLNFAPLHRTLRHTLTYSGKNEDIDDETRSDYTLVFKNFAQLYRGIDLNLSTGVSFPKTEQTDQTSTFTNIGIQLVPHRAMTIHVNYNFRGTEGTRIVSKEGLPDVVVKSSTSTNILNFGVTFTPLRSLHLRADIDVFSEKGGRDRVAQDYGIGWSPFPDGNLQFGFSYDEEYLSLEDRSERTFGPNVRWVVFKRTTLDVSYRSIDIDDDRRSEKTELFNVDLHLSF